MFSPLEHVVLSWEQQIEAVFEKGGAEGDVVPADARQDPATLPGTLVDNLDSRVPETHSEGKASFDATERSILSRLATLRKKIRKEQIEHSQQRVAIQLD
jgi:hypothetical protein